MTSRAELLIAELGSAQRKLVLAEKRLADAEEARRQALVDMGDARADLRVALAAIESEAAGI